MKAIRFLIAASLMLLCVSLLCLSGCTDGGTETPTDSGTAAASETAPGEASGTEPDTIVTEAVTDAPTETPTEAPTEADTARVPTDPTDVFFRNDPDMGKYVSVSNGAMTVEEQHGETVLVISKTDTGDSLKLTIDYHTYMDALGLDPLTAEECPYLVLRFRVKNGADKSLYFRCSAGGKATIRKNINVPYDPDGEDWKYVLIGLSDIEWSGTVDKLSFDFFRASRVENETLIFGSLTLCPDVNTLLAACGRADQTLGYGSDLVVKENDPVTHEPKAAPDEDASVRLWFDHITEKVVQVNGEAGSRAGYTIRLAKNEIEDCQFFLLPETDRRLRVELTDFTQTDGTGTLETTLLFQYYHDVNGVKTPDAIPPVQGALAVRGGQTQGFVIKVKSTADSLPGLYKAVLTVYDDATGKCVRTADVYADVWDFTLTDETTMKTAVEVLYWKIYHTYPEGTDTDALALNYFNFLLDNRINPYQLPFGVREPRAWPLMDNPRVRCFTIPGVEADRHADYTASVYDIMSEHGWLNKAYFYRLDEPTSGGMLENLKSIGESLAPYYPQYRMVSPFYVDITYQGDDMIEFMKPYINIWCAKMNAFTPRELAFIPGAAPLQSEAQDEQYGEFHERMLIEKSEGDELWAYFCFDPCRPYANWMATCDGTEPIVTLWQCKLLDVTGVLMWGANAWPSESDTYTNIKSHDMNNNAYGDGILFYSGAPYGIDTPVSSLRLETIRDGIEDYEYLTMLEKAAGKQASDEFVRLVTTSVLNYTTDDDYLAAVRVMLGDAVEAALKK